MYKPWKGFYIFFDRNKQNKSFLKEQGIIPWWTSENTQVAFWRPVSSLLLLLDFSLIDLRKPVIQGEKIYLSTMEITITEVTPDRRIASALFTFYKPLDSSSRKWIIWNLKKMNMILLYFPESGKRLVYHIRIFDNFFTIELKNFQYFV